MAKGTVLYVGNFELPDKGASANRVVSNAKLFNSIGYQTVLLGVTKDKACTDIRPLKNDFGLMMYERPYPVSMKMWLGHMYSSEYINKMIKLHEDIVLVILYNMPFSALKAVKKACKGKHIKVAYDCTEWADVTDGNAVKRFVKKRDEKLIRNKLADVADGLIVISSMMERQYQGCKAMVKLPPLVDIEDSIWHQQPEQHEGFEFCFAGQLDGLKESLDLVVKSFASVCDKRTKLRIIGVEREDFKKIYPEVINELAQCGNNVIFMGRLTHEETIRYVLGCDCYLFIRYSNIRNNAVFPTKFAEATTCGASVITTDVSDIKIYENEKTIILDYVNTEIISAAMKAVKNKINTKENMKNTFDYRQYKSEAVTWLNCVINGEN